jgi:IclR family transcriptional regulator, mhp operon transcriptional activator
MESTRPIRALMRGLDALTVLNMRDGATVSEVAQEIHLPRTTVYRILETLCDAGFVFRDGADDRYRLTIQVRALSDGFDDEAWVAQIAAPMIQDLSREIVWPIAVATLSGTTMLVRECTDHSSPLAVERHSAGLREPLLTTASGRVYLAYSAVPQREALIDILARSSKEEDKPARARAELTRLLAEIKAAGCATVTRTRRLMEEVSLAVAIMLEDRVIASLTVRFASPAVPAKAGIERFLPKLRQCAAKIGTLYSEQHSEPAQSAQGT